MLLIYVWGNDACLPRRVKRSMFHEKVLSFICNQQLYTLVIIYYTNQFLNKQAATTISISIIFDKTQKGHPAMVLYHGITISKVYVIFFGAAGAPRTSRKFLKQYSSPVSLLPV
jgi:hypothetical protein